MNHNHRIKELNETFKQILEQCPELTFVGDSVLREPTVQVSLEDGLQIAEKLKATLLTYRSIAGFGRGLAAPQIGESKSVFVTYAGDVFKTYINPKVIQFSNEQNFYRESCLSCGYLSVDVKRPSSLTIEYMDEEGNMHQDVLNSFSARLVQHEYDHLLGIVNIDKAEPSSITFMINDPLQEKIREQGE